MESLLQLKLSTTTALGTEESGHCRKVAVSGLDRCNMTTVFFGVALFLVLKMLI